MPSRHIHTMKRTYLLADDVISDPDYTPSYNKFSAPEYEDSLIMVETTPEQQNKDEDDDLNNTVKMKRNKHLSLATLKQNESKEKRFK